MDINKAFPSNYLKAADLGNSINIVTIDRVELEDIGDDKNKPVVYFRGKERGLVCNKTNANTLIELTGTSETDDWAGYRIQLVVVKVEFQGKRVPAIRIESAPSTGATSSSNGNVRRAAAPVKAQPVSHDSVEAPDEDSIPF